MADWRAGKGDGGAAGGEALPMARPTQVALKTGRALALSVGWAQPAPQISKSGGCQLNETHPCRLRWPDAPFAHHTPKPGTGKWENTPRLHSLAPAG